jgi:hypothetical protein
MPSLPPETVAEAMEREIGFEQVDGHLLVRWMLRRIVCEAI